MLSSQVFTNLELTWTSFSKPSKPARAYLQLTQHQHLDSLAEKVKQTSFADARKTDNDSILLGPPILEFAPYNRIPFGRKRNDARQGLIDQDPEFIQFLESLTNPITKPAHEAEVKKAKPTVTPLIQHLRDKKAAKEAAKENKEKPSPQKAGKHARQTSKNDGTENNTATSTTPAKAQVPAVGADKKPLRPGKAERVTKPTTKPGKKDSPIPENKQPASATSKPPQSPQPAPAAPIRRPDGPTANSAAARMIQRDLGIGRGRASMRGRAGRQLPVNGHVPATNAAINPAQDASNPQQVNTIVTAQPSAQTLPNQATSEPATNGTVPVQPVSQPTASIGRAPPTGPKLLNKSVPGTVPPPRPAKAAPTVNPNSRQAFLKHANPSQGITEPLLQEAFAAFGTITKVEIDKRKGFAYVDFTDAEGLQKAVNASPVKVATGSVQVLERRDRPVPPTGPMGLGRGAPPLAPRGAPVGAGFRGGRGSMRGRGGMMRGGLNGFTPPPAHVSNTQAPLVNGALPNEPSAEVSTSSGLATTAEMSMAPTIAPIAAQAASEEAGG